MGFDPAAQRQRLGQQACSRQLGRGQLPGELDDRHRAPFRFPYDPPGQVGIERPGHRRPQQLQGVVFGKAADTDVRNALQQHAAVSGIASTEYQRDPLGVYPSSHHGEDLEGLLVEPLRVVDHAQQRRAGGSVGEERERGQANGEAIRGYRVDEAEGRAERLALALRQAGHRRQERNQQPVQPRKTKLQLRLDAGDADHPESRRRPGGVAQKRRLAHARLTSHHQCGAQPAASGIQRPIQGLPFLKAIHERHGPRLCVAQLAISGREVPVARPRPVSGEDSGWPKPLPAEARPGRVTTRFSGCDERRATVFAEAGYTALTPSWPDDPDTVEEANQHPEVFAHKTVGQVADHYAAVIARLDKKPAVIGHSFGGLLSQMVAGRGLSAATVAIDSAPMRGVLPLPISALRAASPVLGNPANHHRAVPLTYDQFRYAFANAVSEDEAKELYETFAVPASGTPLFQAATANLNPFTEAKADSKNPDRGPMLIISGEKDNTAPPAITNAIYKQQSRNPGVTETVTIPGRGHALVIDSGWREVCDTSLAFIRRFVS